MLLPSQPVIHGPQPGATQPNATPPVRTNLDHPGIEPSAAEAPAPTNMDFIDVSHHQGDINWDQYAASGKKLAICKLTEGSDFVDDKAAENRAEMSKAGVECGLYHFAGSGPAHTIGDATKEADFYLSQVGKMGATEFPVLDFEQADGLTPAQQASWISGWCTEVQDKTGKTPWLYTNEKLLHGMDADASKLTQYPLWLADYNTSDRKDPPASTPWKNLEAWQFTEKGNVAGVSGDVDGSYLYGPAPGAAPPTVPKPEPSKK